jgi:hypothetical protein
MFVGCAAAVGAVLVFEVMYAFFCDVGATLHQAKKKDVRSWAAVLTTTSGSDYYQVVLTTTHEKKKTNLGGEAQVAAKATELRRRRC